jgi:TonB family protein
MNKTPAVPALWLLTVLCAPYLCWGAEHLVVKDVVIPAYPPLARMAKLQGSVRVEIEISTDGRVISAKASGGDPILLRAAEANIRLWTFQASDDQTENPIKHTIIFEYKVVGERVAFPNCPAVQLHLPDRVEISTQPPLLNPDSH